MYKKDKGWNCGFFKDRDVKDSKAITFNTTKNIPKTNAKLDSFGQALKHLASESKSQKYVTRGKIYWPLKYERLPCERTNGLARAKL